MICSGKQQCSLTVSQIYGDGIHPCPVEVMSYLVASYHCVQGRPNVK